MNPGNFTNGASLVILPIPTLGLIGLTKFWTEVGEFGDEVWWVYPVQFCPFDPKCVRGFASAWASLRLRYDEILSWSYDWLVDWKCFAGQKIWLITIVLAIIYYYIIISYILYWSLYTILLYTILLITILSNKYMGGFLKWWIPSRHHGVQYFMVIPCHEWPTRWRPVFGVFVPCSSRSSCSQIKNTTPRWFPTDTQHLLIWNFRPPLWCFVDVLAWAHFF